MSTAPAVSDVLASGLHLVSPAAMAQHLSDGRWRRAPHLTLLSNMLVECAMGERQRLMVFMPPRHGKSELISHWFPVWLLSLMPHKRVILSSYEADFAREWGRKVRNTLESNWPQLGIKVAEDSRAAFRWNTSEGGGMVTAGVGGPITGRGADILIIDDPVKNMEEANSETYREKAWDWWQSTAATRVEPGGCCILVMTRWHEDDLAGRMLADMKADGQQWDVLCLPALAEGSDALNREVGQPLWPDRLTSEYLADRRQAVGSRVWASLYQQRPSPEEGGLLKRGWWQYYVNPPSEFDQTVQSWDLTFKGKTTSDYVVGQVWGRRGGNYFLLDQIRDRMDAPATMQAITAMAAKWPTAVAKLIEDTANGPAVVAILRSQVPGLISVPVRGDKVARLQAVAAPLIEARNVMLPQNAPWISDFVEEASAFPNGANDDQVDAMSQALTYLHAGRRPTLTGTTSFGSANQHVPLRISGGAVTSRRPKW